MTRTGATQDARRTGNILGSPIDAIEWDSALARISEWATQRESRLVCICNVHSLVTARNDAEFGRVLREADLATPDGMPVVVMLRRLGFAGQPRVNGPDLMWKLCARAERSGQSVFFYGSTDAVLDALKARLSSQFPQLRIAGMFSPPFRPLSAEEQSSVVDLINQSGASLLFVGLGCPKQEKWMYQHRGTIQAVMLGVGAAFDYHAGTKKRAPLWMQRSGFEWLHRLCSEPRRLWKRYLVTNTVFLLSAFRQLYLSRRGQG